MSRVWTDIDSMEISMWSTDTMLQPQQVTSPTTASGPSSVDHQVVDQFTQMRSMLASEMEGLKEKDCQTFRNDAVKLLRNIQSRAEECGCQLQQPHQQTLSRTQVNSSNPLSRAKRQPKDRSSHPEGSHSFLVVDD